MRPEDVAKLDETYSVPTQRARAPEPAAGRRAQRPGMPFTVLYQGAATATFFG